MKIGFTANGYMDKKEDLSAHGGGEMCILVAVMILLLCLRI